MGSENLDGLHGRLGYGHGVGTIAERIETTGGQIVVPLSVSPQKGRPARRAG